MTQHVSDIMTSAPVIVEPQTSVTAVARIMRDQDLGAVLVSDGDELRGLATDRDLVVRSLAEGCDPEQITVAGACSDDLVAVTPSASSPSATRPWNAIPDRLWATSAWYGPTPEPGRPVRRAVKFRRPGSSTHVCAGRGADGSPGPFVPRPPGDPEGSMEGR
jgi:hypothetical protein